MPSDASRPSSPRIGATFAGYGGLDEAVAKVFGGKVAWVSEFDTAPSRILAHRYPDAPNHGDITKIDWDTVEPIELFTGGYPCFPTGTLILTRDGWKPIEKVEAGDEVFTHRNRWRPVVRNWGARLGKTVTIKGQGHEGLVATDNHKFPVREKTRTWDNQSRRYVTELSSKTRKLEAKDIEGKFWGTPIEFPAEQVPTLPDVEFDMTSPEFMWVVGAYVADGCVADFRKDGTPLNILFTEGYGAGAGETRCRLAASGFEVTERNQATAQVFKVGHSALATWLMEHFGHGAENKTLPAWVYGLSEAQRRALFDGYIHGDGHKLANGGVRFNTVSKKLAISMRLLAQTLGYYTSVNKVTPAPTKVVEGRTVNQKPWWRVSCSTSSKTAVRADGHQWGKVKSVEYTGRVETVWNLEVAEDNSYNAEGSSTFNCQPFSGAGKRLGKEDPRHLFPHFARAVEKLRPRIVVAENVRGHLSLGFDVVMAEWVRVGYDVQWMTLRAADVGAPHGRPRVFIMATDPEKEAKLEAKGRAFAEFVDSQWVEPGEVLFGVAPFTGRWPTAGRLVDGVAYDNTDVLGDVPAAIFRYLGEGVGQVEHVMPTPSAADGMGGHMTRSGSRSDELLLPGLAVAIGKGQLLPTPRASDGDKGGPNQRGSSGDLMLPSAVVQLLPTPVVNDMGKAYTPEEWDAWTARLKAEHGNGNGHGPSLEIEAARLGMSGRATRRAEVQDGAGERALVDVPAEDEPGYVTVPGYEQWAQYGLAVLRWEIVFGRRAPSPTAPTGKDGAQRLSPRFVEWMMGLPEGWVTDPAIWEGWRASTARNAQLKALGNGVVPRQAETALRLMLATR